MWWHKSAFVPSHHKIFLQKTDGLSMLEATVFGVMTFQDQLLVGIWWFLYSSLLPASSPDLLTSCPRWDVLRPASVRMTASPWLITQLIRSVCSLFSQSGSMSFISTQAVIQAALCQTRFTGLTFSNVYRLSFCFRKEKEKGIIQCFDLCTFLFRLRKTGRKLTEM